MFDSQEEAQMRLRRSLVMYRGKPAFVTDVKSSSRLVLCRVKPRGGLSAQTSEVMTNDPDLDIKPFRLGYVNFNGDAHYTQRMPQRKYKQGLSQESFYIGKLKHRIDSKDLLFSGKPFERMVLNEYPSIEDCFQSITQMGVSSAAFHREWAIGLPKFNVELALQEGAEDPELVRDDELVVYYKGKRAGLLDEDQNIILDDDRQYLIEALKEAIE